MTNAVLIVGLGNSLLQDDGVGVQTARLLKTDPPPGADVVEGGTDLMSLAPYLERYPQVLAIDAMDAGGRPGTLYECALEDLEPPGQCLSLHELGLRSVLEFIDPAQRPQITILGIQPERMGYGLELSATLRARLPKVAAAAGEIVAQLRDSRVANRRCRGEALAPPPVERGAPDPGRLRRPVLFLPSATTTQSQPAESDSHEPSLPSAA